MQKRGSWEMVCSWQWLTPIGIILVCKLFNNSIQGWWPGGLIIVHQASALKGWTTSILPCWWPSFQHINFEGQLKPYPKQSKALEDLPSLNEKNRKARKEQPPLKSFHQLPAGRSHLHIVPRTMLFLPWHSTFSPFPTHTYPNTP